MNRNFRRKRKVRSIYRLLVIEKSGVQFGLTSYAWFHNQTGMQHKLIWDHKYDFGPKFLRHKVTLFNQFWNCKVSFTSYIVRLSHEKAPHRNPKITIVCVHFPWDNLYLPMKFTFLCIKMYFFYLRGLWNTVIVNESLMNMNKNSQMINGFGLTECGHHKWQWWCSSAYDNSDERSCRGTCDFYFGLFL